MNETLTLGNLVKLSELCNSHKFSDKSPFDYLGKKLTSFLEEFLEELGVKDEPIIKGNVAEGAIIKGKVYIAEGAKVEPTAYIEGPTYIGEGAQIRHAAYIRGSAYIGKKAVVGHTTEVKGAIFFDDAKAGHFAYIGDSILGRNVNLGAGTKLANLKLKGDEVKVQKAPGSKRYSSGLRKLGALLGDNAQTGCNAVLSPGTVLYPDTGVLPCLHFHGTLVEGLFKGK